MTTKTQTLKFKQMIGVTPDHVYRALTNSTALREWLCDAAQVDVRKGGRLHLWWNTGYYTTGEFTSLVPDKRVAFTWRGQSDPDATQVRVSLTAKNGGTAVTLTHQDVGTGRAWTATVEGFKHEWTRNLDNLKSVLETGHDLRFTLRPMLGILAGAPVDGGLFLDSVADGMGAQAAGLQKGDVIVGFAGKKVIGWPTIAGALQSYRAGDAAKVTFVRGTEKHMVSLVLSGRQIDEPPSTARELAGAMQQIYADLDAKLAACFVGASEEAASRKPAPQEWSAKDVVCHLITGERDTHTWIGNLIGGQEPWSDAWAGNIDERHVGIQAAYPTVADLLEELRRNECETVAILAALPEAFVARKGSYWRLAYALMQTPLHNEAHLDQIRAAIELTR